MGFGFRRKCLVADRYVNDGMRTERFDERDVVANVANPYRGAARRLTQKR